MIKGPKLEIWSYMYHGKLYKITVKLSRFSEGKPTIAFAQRSEVGVGSGIFFRFMTPGFQKYPYRLSLIHISEPTRPY